MFINISCSQIPSLAGWGRVRHSWYIYRDNTDYHYRLQFGILLNLQFVHYHHRAIFFIIIINFHYLLTYMCLSTSPVAKFLVWLAGVESGTRGTSIEILQIIIIFIIGILLNLQYINFHRVHYHPRAIRYYHHKLPLSSHIYVFINISCSQIPSLAGWGGVRHSWYIYRDITDHHYRHHCHLISWDFINMSSRLSSSSGNLRNYHHKLPLSSHIFVITNNVICYSQILSLWLRGNSWLWHRVGVPSRQ